MADLTSLFGDQISPEIFTSIFAGGFVVSVMGYAAFTLRALPHQIWRFLKNQFSVTISVHSDQPTFQPLDLWLSRLPSTKSARRLSPVCEYSDQGERHTATLGYGAHLVRVGGRRWLVERHGADQPAANGVRNITLSLTTLGRSPAPLFTLLDQIMEHDETAPTVPVMVWANGYYRRLAPRRIREIGSVVVRPGVVEGMLSELRGFLDAEDWYAERGIPWRYGCFLEGPPGTGKSTLIFAIAGALRKSIHLISLSMVNSDHDLQEAMLRARGGVVAIEDIDAAMEAKAREPVADAPRGPPGIGPERQGVTLSGLLNAIDGIAAGEGRILFMTSNHPEKLDPALLRPGRADMRVKLDLADEEIASAMYDRFFPEANDGKVVWLQGIKKELPMAQADVQERLIRIARRNHA